MLEHLINFEPDVGMPTNFIPLEKAGVNETVDAKLSTTEWLKSIGAVDEKEVVSRAQAEAARNSFSSMVSAAPAEMTHTSLAEVKTPQAVQHLVGMLTAYDWEFVEQAKALRGYCVAKLIEEVENPSANIRLKALGLLGKVTEVGLFTDKLEVKQAEMSDAQIEQRIKDKLNKFMKVVDVIDVSAKEDTDGS
jgi:hypothetical protein